MARYIFDRIPEETRHRSKDWTAFADAVSRSLIAQADREASRRAVGAKLRRALPDTQRAD